MSVYQSSLIAPRSVNVGSYHTRARDISDSSENGPCLARMKLYERALDRDPINHLLLLDLAREYGRHGRLTEARCMLRRVVRLYPESARIRSMVAAVYGQVGLLQLAREQYEAALLIDPDQLHSATFVQGRRT
jgi:Tfp pilus assembly protein PilF